jgi:5-methylthioadenosine/S-adenosylhomocysteine deaminase
MTASDTVRAAAPADLSIEGGVVLTLDAARRILDPGYVLIRDGMIVDVGPGAPRGGPAAKRIDAGGRIVLPGLVNAHDHLDQCLYRGILDEEPNSRDLILGMARGLTRERAQIAASLTLLEQVKHGITTTHESHWTHYHIDSTDGICDAIVQSGMRAVVARSMNDNEETLPEFRERHQDVAADLDRLDRAYAPDRIQIIPEPTTVLRVSPDAIHAMRDWARQRGRIWHIHLAQNNEERDDALRKVGCGAVQYAEKLGILGPEVLAAHCCGLLDEEPALLAKYGVRVAHCPCTVIRGGSTVPPIWQLERDGAQVAVCTDGSGTNNGQNPWEAMKLAIYMQRVRFADRHLGHPEQALEMMTTKAARALEMHDRVGALEPGKAADIAILRRDQVHLMPDARMINNLVYSGGSTYAETVLVGGKVVLADGRSTVFDEEEIIRKAGEVQAAMIREADLGARVTYSRSWPIVRA